MQNTFGFSRREGTALFQELIVVASEWPEDLGRGAVSGQVLVQRLSVDYAAHWLLGHSAAAPIAYGASNPLAKTNRASHGVRHVPPNRA